MAFTRGPALSTVASRLSGWPRRIAAMVCLLLAAASFVHHTAVRQDARGRGLDPGQVAVAVQVAAEVRSFVHAGDRVDLVAGVDPASDSGPPGQPASALPPTPAPALARGVRVLAVLPPPQGFGAEATAGLLVAADRDTATTLAAARGRQMTALLSG